MKKTICIFLVFFLFFGFAVPAFAESEYEPPNLDGTGFDSYYIIETDKRVACVLYSSSEWDLYIQRVTLEGWTPNTFYLFSNLQSSTPPKYSNILKSNYTLNGWGEFSNINVNPFTQGTYDFQASFAIGQPTYVVSSNRDIRIFDFDSELDTVTFTNDVFFSPTPPLVVATGEALTQFQTQTSQNLMIIALCGVGCLAFLISLPILRKVLLRFLNR